MNNIHAYSIQREDLLYYRVSLFYSMVDGLRNDSTVDPLAYVCTAPRFSRARLLKDLSACREEVWPSYYQTPSPFVPWRGGAWTEGYTS